MSGTLLINEEQLKEVKAVVKILYVDFTSKKIEESRKQGKEGKVRTIDAKDLWK